MDKVHYLNDKKEHCTREMTNAEQLIGLKINWHEPIRPCRFFMTDEQYVDLLAAYPEMSIAFSQANLPVHKADGGRYIYYSILYPEHRVLLESFGANFENKE